MKFKLVLKACAGAIARGEKRRAVARRHHQVIASTHCNEQLEKPRSTRSSPRHECLPLTHHPSIALLLPPPLPTATPR